MQLRDYQSTALKNTFAAWEEYDSALIVHPTGTGKTITSSHIIQQALAKFGGRAKVVAHRDELIRQAADKITRVSGLRCDIEMGEMKADTTLFGRAPVVVSSVQTQNAGMDGAGRMTKFDPSEFSILVIDEAHHATAATYRRMIDYYRRNTNLKVLGITATPDRSDKEALGQVFEVCVHDYELEDAIQDGWLVRPDQRCVTVSSLDISKVRTTAGDLNVGDLAEIMESETELHHIASPTYKIANGRKTLVFATTVAHAESLCEIFNRYKQGCASFVCGKTPKYERRQIFADYAAGRTQFLCNVGVATEGFDDPGIEVVAIARPTKSRALYSQMVGRGTRPEEAIASHLGDIETAELRRVRIAQSSKPHCEIIDFVGNSGKHKLVCTADILGGNYSDVVIDRARKIAEEADGELVDMDEALEAAAGQVKREEEKAREIQRRKHIIAEAEFVIEEIDPFDVFDVRAPREPGWHKGREPTEKQAAMLSGHGIKMDKMTFCKASRLISEITKRRKDGLCTFRQAEQLKKFGHRTDLTFDQARDTLSRAVVTPRKTIKVY